MFADSKLNVSLAPINKNQKIHCDPDDLLHICRLENEKQSLLHKFSLDHDSSFRGKVNEI